MNLFSGLKSDILPTFVFNNLYWLTFIFNPPFFGTPRDKILLTYLISATCQFDWIIVNIANCLSYHQLILRKAVPAPYCEFPPCPAFPGCSLSVVWPFCTPLFNHLQPLEIRKKGLIAALRERVRTRWKRLGSEISNVRYHIASRGPESRRRLKSQIPINPMNVNCHSEPVLQAKNLALPWKYSERDPSPKMRAQDDNLGGFFAAPEFSWCLGVLVVQCPLTACRRVGGTYLDLIGTPPCGGINPPLRFHWRGILAATTVGFAAVTETVVSYQ